jgi:hypothetical protein
MKNLLLSLMFLVVVEFTQAQEIRDTILELPEIPVSVLGTFHFSYPNLDRITTEKEKQVNILSLQRQGEILELVNKLKAFQPTIIAIEYPVEKQSRIDSLYTAFCNGSLELPAGEHFQIGFRLAKETGLQKVHCIDTWGDYERFMDQDTFWIEYEKYLDSNRNERYDAWSRQLNERAVNMSLIDYFILINGDSILNKIQSGYFLSNFIFERRELDYSGVDWVTAQWYNRNLRIIRNLMRIQANEQDKIFILYGNGHHALLRDYLEYSPFYRYDPVINYLNEKTGFQPLK